MYKFLFIVVQYTVVRIRSTQLSASFSYLNFWAPPNLPWDNWANLGHIAGHKWPLENLAV